MRITIFHSTRFFSGSSSLICGPKKEFHKNRDQVFLEVLSGSSPTLTSVRSDIDLSPILKKVASPGSFVLFCAQDEDSCFVSGVHHSTKPKNAKRRENVTSDKVNVIGS
ncbi:hypothetical protein TNIN_379081 [Trichonephila inaurata madagascariensis]|uniref:Uncharacterized protein n=1 Tax=Trichonephila inaurata madagascariensis TaxID=2747483 RepID=A0A8X6XSW6_9ARAC|nr:hypothetical protein TNIN_379081 [Trichonephila inaurata madagascariensis]